MVDGKSKASEADEEVDPDEVLGFTPASSARSSRPTSATGASSAPAAAPSSGEAPSKPARATATGNSNKVVGGGAGRRKHSSAHHLFFLPGLHEAFAAGAAADQVAAAEVASRAQLKECLEGCRGPGGLGM